MPCRSFVQFDYSTLETWSRPRRVIGKAEILLKGNNPRFIVTNLPAEGFTAVSNAAPGMDLTSNRVGSGRSRTIYPRESQVCILSLMSPRNDLQGANSLDSERMGIRFPDALSQTPRSPD